MKLTASLASVLCALLVTAGCDQPARTEAIAATPAAALVPPPEFSPRTDCTPLTRWTGPDFGSRYVYRRADGTTSERTILSVADGVVGFRYRDLSTPGLEALPPRYAVAGLLAVYPEPGAARRVDHARPPLPAIQALAVGQSATIHTVEFSRIKGVERRVAFPTTVRYRACGDLSVAGRAMPVRVYDVATARRVVDPRTGEAVRQSQIAYFLSDETGYPLAIQDQTSTVAIRIEPATPAPS